MGTGVQTIEETERLLDNTDKDLVFLCYDTGHFTFSGEELPDSQVPSQIPSLFLQTALLQGTRKTTCLQFSFREGPAPPLIRQCPLDTCCRPHENRMEHLEKARAY